ncbi:hypothetical protein LTR53_011959 [Teratosphaeriaceae sp. CCFEE 6253]|nr:hypothetical protein LTR53_011959 [Teratosphaeriaceae sp. CCFEE 6253]
MAILRSSTKTSRPTTRPTGSTPEARRPIERPSEAAQTVLALPELHDMILSHLPLRQQYAAARVSTAWRDRVAASPVLQYEMFRPLAPVPRSLAFAPALTSFEGLEATRVRLNPLFAGTFVLSGAEDSLAYLFETVVSDCAHVGEAGGGFYEDLLETEVVPTEKLPAEKEEDESSSDREPHSAAVPASAPRRRLLDADLRPLTYKTPRKAPPPDLGDPPDPIDDELPRILFRQPGWKEMQVAHPPIRALGLRRHIPGGNTRVICVRREDGLRFLDLLLGLHLHRGALGDQWPMKEGDDSRKGHGFEMLLSLAGRHEGLEEGEEAESWRACRTVMRCRVESAAEGERRRAVEL